MALSLMMKSAGSRKSGRKAHTCVFLSVVLFASSCSTESSESDDPGPSVKTLPQITPAPPTTEFVEVVFTDDLPMADQSSAESQIIEVQKALNQYCCAIDVAGTWTAETAEAVNSLRSLFGLENGGVDPSLWQKILEVPLQIESGSRKSDLFGLPIPKETVLYAGQLSPPNESYVITGTADFVALKGWFDNSLLGKNQQDWTWCTAPESDFTKFEYRWWKKSREIAGPILRLQVEYRGVGRTDIKISEIRNPFYPCEGYVAPPATTQTTTKPSSGSSSSGGSSGGGGGGCYIGMNLEDCEDLLGVGIGGRLPTIDCSGRDRSVFWASNWWIIGSASGIPIISKSKYYCS